MENIFSRRLELRAFEEDSAFSKTGGPNKFNSLNLKRPITFFSGENGTGEPTLLEVTAVNWGFNPEGGNINFNFSTKDTHLDSHSYLAVEKGVRRVTDGFLLRAESFYNVAACAENIDLGLSEYGGKFLHRQSHGESSLNLMGHRLRGSGLYLLDEPEMTPSLQRQLALMISIKKLIDEGSQFIIVSHSPILLAIPNS